MPWDIKKIICIVVPLATLLLPSQFIPIEGGINRRGTAHERYFFYGLPLLDT